MVNQCVLIKMHIYKRPYNMSQEHQQDHQQDSLTREADFFYV